ncbi:helix-turn-helix domain-containing protein [Nonomuraea sp. K274]|uniref:Helix-turn-helix domain-containing protein n=1 Tax=Nonomuraea cypriaca TaxID=1187855 RepID=A0A931AIA8_9ACTN|nr:helix-turn-helix domain-containing protein [Nonomuraea cypriaca]MBF8192195.1 helix-turn-helix domain-containing protein [Nonomuraea cypriaca]
MAVLIRTSDLPAGHRHDAWRSLVCDTLGPLDLRIDPDAPLRGEMRMAQLGRVGVGRVRTSTPHSMHRTPGLIHRGNPELYRVVLAISGSPRLAQDGRQTRLAPGEFAIYDFTRPYEVAYDAAVQLAVFSLPHDLLALPIGSVAALTAVPITAESGTAALAAPLLRRVALDLETYRPGSAAKLGTVVMDLVGAAVAERLESVESLPEDSRQRTLLLRVHAFIEERLGDIDLDPATVAAAHHISVRYLHRLFETENTTVAAWIRERRLERCRAELAAGGSQPVSVIAARWGLPDSAHFSRLFRRAYGVPPAEYRRAHSLPPGDHRLVGAVL